MLTVGFQFDTYTKQIIMKTLAVDGMPRSRQITLKDTLPYDVEAVKQVWIQGPYIQARKVDQIMSALNL